ncbi:Kinesin motor domain containing protein [Reticulomyxa filosa]|uniref:Kinesin motor domain containing protein n=1 Tax=Reticulomyxa filosa TaxID=46433 RepID=X6N0X8_RETFI|nr:Kinesin motor domain containing protein [Reticulomyxa filosa]|eukprot:ETO19364.1 Kinesin motor domain containing protein [Reticulomyxa filosa]
MQDSEMNKSKVQQGMISEMQSLLMKTKPTKNDKKLGAIRVTNEEIQLQVGGGRSSVHAVVLKKGRYRTLLLTSEWDKNWVNTYQVWTAFEHIVQYLIKLQKFKNKESDKKDDEKSQDNFVDYMEMHNSDGDNDDNDDGDADEQKGTGKAQAQQRMLQWGTGSSHETLSTITPVDLTSSDLYDQLLSISSSAKHTLFRTAFGRVFSFGFNSYGQLGLGDRDSRSAPAPILALQDKNIVSIECGSNYSLAVDSNGNVLRFCFEIICEHGKQVKCKQKKKKIYALDVLKAKMDERAKKKLQKQSKIIPIEKLQSEYLPTASNSKTTSSASAVAPIPVASVSSIPPTVPLTVPISSNSNSNSNSIATSTSQSRSQPQVNEEKKEDEDPDENEEIDEEATKLLQSLVFGTSQQHFVVSPILLRSLERFKIIKVTAGSHHTLCLDESHQVWGLGKNDFGQLGLNDPSISQTCNACVMPFHPEQEEGGLLYELNTLHFFFFNAQQHAKLKEEKNAD